MYKLLQELRTTVKFGCALIVIFTIGGCDEGRNEDTPPQIAPSVAGLQEPEAAASTPTYRDLQWEELIPKDDLDALLNPPDFLQTIAEGSAEDSLEASTNGGEENQNLSRYQEALKSTRIKPEFDRENVRIPGFIVPLEFDDNQTITSFLLVPFFGACIHLPPPPPNQVVYADFPEGFQIEALYDPFYIEGELRTLPEETEQGTAAYSMQVQRVYPYEE